MVGVVDAAMRIFWWSMWWSMWWCGAAMQMRMWIS
jgi:hypothetical protein